jgi:hypothetical protein
MLLESKVSGWHQIINERLNKLGATTNLQELSREQLTRALSRANPVGSADNLALIDRDGQAIASTDSQREGSGTAENLNQGTATAGRSDLLIDVRPNGGREELHITLPLAPESLNRQDHGKPPAFLSYTIPIDGTLKDFCRGSDAFDDLTIIVAKAPLSPASATGDRFR